MRLSMGLKIWLAGFAIALAGAAIGAVGFRIDHRPLAIAGWAIGVSGTVVGAVGILYGWVTIGPEAILGGIRLTLTHARTVWARIISRRE